MADICIECAKKHIDVLEVGDVIVKKMNCSNCKTKDTNKTILFGLKIEEKRLREEIKIKDRQLGMADNHERITDLGFAKQVLIDKHEEILEDIKKYDVLGSLNE